MAVKYKYGNYNPGKFKMDKKFVKQLRPEVYSFKQGFVDLGDVASMLKYSMKKGDTEPAVVVSVEPLLVACYAADMDAVALLCLPTEYGMLRNYQVGTRLLTVNSYDLDRQNKTRRSEDIFEGEHSSGRFRMYGPLIADLYTKNTKRLEAIKAQIPEEVWNYVAELGEEYMRMNPGMARNGLGNRFCTAIPISEITFHPKMKIPKA